MTTSSIFPHPFSLPLDTSKPPTKSPKHCAKKGCNLNFLNKKLFKIFSTLVFSILSLILLIWFVLHPVKPQFILQEVDIYQLNLSSPHLLNSSHEITFEARNCNQKVGIFYEKLKAYASYKGHQISVETLIPLFYQGQQDSNLLSVSLRGTDLPVAASLGYEVSRGQAVGKLVLIIKVDGRIR